MTWETVVNKTETVRTHNTARDTNFFKKEQAYLQFFDTQECCVISELFLQFNFNNATQYCTVIQSWQQEHFFLVR